MKRRTTVAVAMAAQIMSGLSLFGQIPAGEPPLPISFITCQEGDRVNIGWPDPTGAGAASWKLYSATDLLGNWTLEAEGPLSQLSTNVVMDHPQKFYRLHAVAATTGGYDFTMWDQVGHTIMINLTNNCLVTKLPADFNVTNDTASTTYHLYMRYIKPGATGQIGSDANEFGRMAAREALQTKTLANGYYMGVYMVTEAQYAQVMGSGAFSANPQATVSYYFLRDNLPPTSTIPANENGTFMERLNYHVRANNPGLALISFDLPTEAQWEIACRAGTTGTFSDNDDVIEANGRKPPQISADLLPTLGQIAWYSSNSVNTAHAVGLLKPNRAGMYDVHGNVREWCLDAYDTSDTTNTSGDLPRAVGLSRVWRSAYYRLEAEGCRTASRSNNTGNTSDFSVGFRLRASGAAAP